MTNIKKAIDKIYSFIEPLFKEPKKHLKTWLVIVGVLVASWAVVFFLRSPEPTQASWWDETWLYRRAITASNGSGYEAENVPYLLILDTETLISNGKIQADGADIRILDREGKLVRFQIEQSTFNTPETGIWFEVNVPANSSKQYYIYYGNNSASAVNFNNDVDTVVNDGETVEMTDGFGYSTSASHARVSDIRKNGTNLKTNGNYHHTTGYPGNWWDDRSFSRTLLASGPLFAEVKYEDADYGDYSSLGTNIKLFNNGFAEVRVFMNYNASGTDTLYYYLHFDNDTRNSVWIDGSGNLVDIDANSGTLYEASLGDNWFGQRWTSTGFYGGTIVRKNGSDWNRGATSTRSSYYQTNYSYGVAYSDGDSREIRYGIFAGDGGLNEMVRKASSYGNSSTSPATEEISPGPVAYWKFDEGTGTTANDSSGQGNNGNIVNGPSWQNEENCVFGKCMAFNASEYVDLGNPKALQITGSKTISMWLKPANFSARRNPYAKAYGGEGTITQETNGALNYYYGTAGGNSSPYQGFNSNQSLTLNEWNHIVIVRDLENMKLRWYINGKETSETNASYAAATASSLTAYIGHGYTSRYAGLIDEVKIYPYARTADQIKTDYIAGAGSKGGAAVFGHKTETAQVTPISSKLVAHWRFDEGHGTTAYNSGFGGSVLNGTLTGTTKPEWTNEGKVGKALFFNNGYIQTEPYTLNSSFSYSVWFNPASFVNWAGVTTNLKHGAPASGLNLVPRNNSMRICYGNGTDSYSYYDVSISGLITNRWHHATITYNGTVASLYFNGKLHDSRNITVAQSSQRIRIGIWASSYSEYLFDGLIDEVKIYNYALSEDEVRQDYNQGAAAVMGAMGTDNSGNPSFASSAEYCIPGDTATCDSPAARWDFEEGSGDTVYDTSGNGNDGTWSGSGIRWGTGKIGKTGVFNGSDTRVSVGNGDSITINGAMTISAWIRLNEDAVTGWIRPIFDKMYIAASKTSGYALYISSGNIALAYGNGTSGESTSTSGLFWDTTQWYHIVATHDGNNTVKIYRDGILVAEKSNAIGPVIDNGDYGGIIGRRAGSTYTYFDGLIDDLRIYDYARTPAQIAWDYNRGAPIGHWKFDECQGTTAHDASGNGNHGAINIGSSAPQTTVGTCSAPTDGTGAWYNGRKGRLNSAMSFDGVDDWVSISDNANHFDFGTGNFTFAAWIYKPSGGKTSPGIISKNGNPGYKFNLNADTGLYLGIYDGSWHNYVSVSGIVKNNSWQHVAITADRDGNVGYFVNGELKDTDNISDTALVNLSNSSSLLIGDDNWCRSYYCGQFDGFVDDVEIFNYALTPLQIKTLHNDGAVNFR